MVANRKSLSFGRYLMAARLEKGISLRDVSRATRIGIDTLGHIENEDHSRLPAEVFVKGFLRAYAKSVGADSEKAVQLYLDNLHILQAASRFETELVRSRERFWPRLLMALGLLLCIMVLSVYGDNVLYRFSSSDVHAVHSEAPAIDPGVNSAEISGQKETAGVKQANTGHGLENTGVELIKDPPDVGDPGGTIQETPPAGEAEVPEKEDISEKLLLKIITVEKTWLKVIVDTHDPVEYSLKPADRLELEATSGFNLLIGNATGIRLFLNGNPIPVPGKQGQVVTLQIP